MRALTAASKPLCYGTALTTSAGAVYTCPTGQSGGITYIRGIKLDNRTAGALTCTLNLVPAGGSVTNANEFYSAISIPANTCYEPAFDEGEFSLRSGDAIYALCSSAAGVNIFIFGAELAA